MSKLSHRAPATVLAAALLAAPTLAGPATDTLAQCLVGKTSGDERVMMIRWMALAFAAHPQVGSVVTFDPGQVETADRAMAALFTALLADRCRAETIAAFAADGQLAFEQSFAVLGQVASQELAMAPEVNAAMTGFINYVDSTKLDPLFQ